MVEDYIFAPDNFEKLRVVPQGVLLISNSTLNVTYCICAFQVFVTFPSAFFNKIIAKF